jgi:hypothetical protein
LPPWSSLEALKAWLAEQCNAHWQEAKHAEWPELTIADVLQDEQTRLMPNPKSFDDYVELPAQVSSTSLSRTRF